MILYRSNADEFKNEADDNTIGEKIEAAFEEKMGRKASPSEQKSWNNSMQFMNTIIRKSEIPADCGILVEYNIPATNKRIDFVITGHDDRDFSNFIIVELKQWQDAIETDKEDIVKTYLGGSLRETTHPSYQAYSYKRYLNDMNAAITENSIKTVSCAYLHNYVKKEPEPLLSNQYMEIVADTPVFFKHDTVNLQKYIRRYVGKGKGMEILYKIENGRIVPSKKFVEYVSEIFKGNPVYTLLDEQKVAYSNIIKIVAQARHDNKKTVIIVNGGPGTGKSVVAMNALVSLMNREMNVRFVAPNASFRESMLDYLGKKDKKGKNRLKAMFSGSASFWDANENTVDALLVDEAHRLKKEGAYQYKGKSQVEDIIRAAKVSVFFVDDNQMIRPDDEGSVARILQVSKEYNAEFNFVELKAQFRCSGAAGYINWVEHTLQIDDTGNYDGWDKESFEFKIFDDPNEMFEAIIDKNKEGLKARMLAGFAWKWTSEKDGNANAEIEDVCIDEFNFRKPWNSRSNQTTWAVDDSKLNQIGCIHTSQGLEFDYVGVIIGKDLCYDPSNKSLYASINDYKDTTGKKGLKNKPEVLLKYIKNIYKVLMSRGMKGCYIFCCDKELGKYFKERTEK